MSKIITKLVELNIECAKLRSERDDLLRILGSIADAANAGQHNISREESVAKILNVLREREKR